MLTLFKEVKIKPENFERQPENRVDLGKNKI